MSNKHFNREDKFRNQSYRKDFKEKQVDLDDKNEITIGKEIDEEVPKYFEKIERPVHNKKEPTTVKGIVKVLSNMRSGPGLDYSVVEVLKPGESITIYEYPGDFYKVKHNDVDGYIKKDLCARVGIGIQHLI